MRLRILLALMLLAFIGGPIAVTPARSEASAFKQIDQKLVLALKEPPGLRALEMFGDADQMINAIHRQRQPQKGGATDLDVTVRASLIDSLRDVVALDMSNATLESVRAQVKVLDLVRSLWEASATKQAERTPELDQLVTAHYDRLARTGAQDRNASITYGIPEGEKLLYRIFVQRDGGQLSAFELSGNKTQRRAIWRETRLPARADGLPAKASTIIGAATNTKVAYPANEYPFVLLVAGGLADADVATEGKIAQAFGKLPQHGIVPLMLEGEARLMPLLLVPTIPPSADARAGMRGSAAALFHRSSETELAAWETVASLRDLDRVIAAAAEVADEATGDLGRATRPSPKESPTLASLVETPTSTAKDTAGHAMTTIVTTKAAPVAGGSHVSLKPDMPVYLRATLAGSNWGQYGLGSSEAEALVWLRRDQVQAYVPPKKDVEEETATESAKAVPKAKPSVEPKAGTVDKIRDWLVGDNKKKAQ